MKKHLLCVFLFSMGLTFYFCFFAQIRSWMKIDKDLYLEEYTKAADESGELLKFYKDTLGMYNAMMEVPEHCIGRKYVIETAVEGESHLYVRSYVTFDSIVFRGWCYPEKLKEYKEIEQITYNFNLVEAKQRFEDIPMSQKYFKITYRKVKQ